MMICDNKILLIQINSSSILFSYIDLGGCHAILKPTARSLTANCNMRKLTRILQIFCQHRRQILNIFTSLPFALCLLLWLLLIGVDFVH